MKNQNNDISLFIEEMKSSKFTLIAGRPGMGKTALALNIANYLSYSEPSSGIAYFSLEIPTKLILERLFSNLTNTGYINTKNLNLGINELQKSTCSNLIIDDSVGLDISMFKNRLATLKDICNLRYIFIDYLQLMKCDRDTSRQNQIRDILTNLKAIAENNNISIILLSQLMRDIDQRLDKRPNLSDLKHLPAFDTCVKKIIFVYRDNVYTKESSEAPDYADLIVTDIKTGSDITYKLEFCKNTLSFQGF
jgi:replicative DNA helicase